ncbi:DUF6461 domain-containing protein [Nonomuraea angiospora]|uniref:Uncharacterized protein n=1 Tax=Nonomuraea angiospora TaxID=46172 RepID=A0ABR9M109_9ACTN|nr:DUF6461 domain-containing protein [Nonomuraea angiospora]MBE1586568.1 hypothetical protein [Nonomuraea angiospora]
MGSASPMGYAWFFEEYQKESDLIGVTFVRGLSPEEACHRIGATPGDTSREVGIAAYAGDGGTVLIDYHCQPLPETLSQGTEMARVITGVTMDEHFVYSVDGVVVTEFEPFFPGDRNGSDPDRLLAHMRELGMPLDGEADGRTSIALAFALAAEATGVTLTPAHYAAEPVVGSID